MNRETEFRKQTEPIGEIVVAFIAAIIIYFALFY